MATIIKIKKSTGVAAPTTLGTGELGYTYGTGTTLNLGDRLFIGTGTETAGVAANIEVIGGKYFADKLDHTPGTLTASSAILVDASSKIDQLLVDNLKIDGNSITSEDTNGNINITPDGTGKSIVSNMYTDTNTSLAEYIEDLSGGSIVGSTGITATYDDTAGTTTLTTTDVPNSALTNSSITVTDGANSTAISLGGTVTVSATANETTISESGGTITVGLPSTVSGLSGVSATNLTGTLQTAAQPNVTSLGSLNGLTIAATQTISMGSNRVTNVTNPTGDQDAATKSYVDAVKTGLDVKDSVRVASIGSATLATAFSVGQTVDGVALVLGDRILIKGQTTGSENGIYTVNAAGVAPSRSTDMDSNAEVSGGLFTFVEEGTVNADSGWVVTTNGTITLGTTSLVFAQFSGAGQITAGAALTKTGNTLDVAVDGSSIEITTDALNVKAGGITNAMLAGSIDMANKVTGILGIVNGGTGASSLTANRLMMANGTGALTVIGAGTQDQFLMSNGASAPAFSDIDGGTF
jgi:hypothetical protein